MSNEKKPVFVTHIPVGVHIEAHPGDHIMVMGDLESGVCVGVDTGRAVGRPVGPATPRVVVAPPPPGEAAGKTRPTLVAPSRAHKKARRFRESTVTIPEMHERILALIERGPLRSMDLTAALKLPPEERYFVTRRLAELLKQGRLQVLSGDAMNRMIGLPPQAKDKDKAKAASG